MENTNIKEALTPDEFAARYAPLPEPEQTPVKYFNVGFDTGNGIYSANIIYGAPDAVQRTAERHAERYGYRIAYMTELPECELEAARAKGKPIYPADADDAEPVNAPQDRDESQEVQKDEAQAAPEDDYFIVNNETGKLELHFAKSTYDALDDETKRSIKGAFLWGRNSGCWISRRKVPNLWHPKSVAKKLGLYDAGTTGERLSFAEQMERKAERAERRADRYEDRSDAAYKRGEALQKPINDMHGDIAFFTQPNINTSAGRAFTNRRNRMWESFEQGFKEFNKSAYWKGRAETARATASQKELQDRGFIGRRIAERESIIRKLKKNIEEYDGYIAAIDRGETPHGKYGYDIKLTKEQLQAQIDEWLDRLEARLDELGFYQDCMDKLGGVRFSRDNIKVGYHVRYRGKNIGEVISVGPKNVTIRDIRSTFTYTPIVAYAEIDEIVKASEGKTEPQPFKVGETFTVTRWNREKDDSEKVTYTIIKATDKSVTLQTGDEKPIVRRPSKVRWSRNIQWALSLSDWGGGTFYRDAAQQAETK